MKKIVLAAAMMFGACVETGDEVELGSVEGEVSCTGQACDALDPLATGCFLDAVVVADGKVFQGGTQIGGLELRYSPTCQAVYTASGYYQPQNHRTCAVRRNPTNNQEICNPYTQSLGNVSPLRYIAVGKTAFGRTVLSNNTNVAGRTADWTRTY